MRIISGKYRGKKLTPPHNLKLRPTTDFAKEGLFNMLNGYCDFRELTFLDIFSGTGSISYEFISRGASMGDMVDISTASHKYRLKMIDVFNQKGFRSHRIDAFRYLRTCNKKYDVIFADPPYGKVPIEKIPQLVFDRALLNENGLLVLEHPSDISFEKQTNFVEARNYGRVNFSFFKAKDNSTEEE